MQRTAQVFYAVVVIIWGGRSALFAQEKQQACQRLAVFDFASPAAAPWLGPGMSEAIATKLAGIDGIAVLERSKIQAIITAARDKKIDPKLVGVDYLLTGSVQLAGTWSNADTRLRVSAKVIAAATALSKGNTAFVVDGTVGKLFDLETQLADHFTRILGRKPAQRLIGYHEERNIQARQFFSQALLLLDKAERLRNTGVDKQVSGVLRHAIKLFRQAQEINEGSFFARAHYYEGVARQELAACQTTETAAWEIHQKTIAQFRKDAAQAAPAFFDLGRALQANEEYAHAIKSYKEYLRWMDEKTKSVRWDMAKHTPSHFAKKGCYIPDLVGVDVPGTTHFSYYLVTDSMIIVPQNTKLIALDIETGRKQWQIDLPLRRSTPFLTGCNGLIAVLAGTALWVIDEKKGQVLARNQKLPLPAERYAGGYTFTYVYWPDKKARSHILAYRETLPDNKAANALCCLASVALPGGELLWHKKWQRPFGSLVAHFRGKVPEWNRNGRFFYERSYYMLYPQVIDGAVCYFDYKEKKLVHACMDTKTGKGAADRFAPTFFNCKQDRYYFPDATGGGWLVAFPYDSKTLAVWGTHGAKSDPVKLGADIGFTCTMANWEKRVYASGLDPNDKYKAVVMYDGKLKSFRPVPWSAIGPALSALKAHGSLQLWGDTLLVSQDMRELLLWRIAPQLQRIWRYRSRKRFPCQPILKDGILVCPQATKLYRRAISLCLLHPPTAIAPFRESRVWYSIAVCYGLLKKRKDKIAALRKALKANARHPDALYALARALLADRKALEAWKIAEQFFLQASSHDIRRAELWHEIVRINGILLHIDPSMGNHFFLDTRILADRHEIALTGGKSMLSIYNIQEPAKGWRSGAVAGEWQFPNDICEIIARDKNHLTVYAETDDTGQSLFVRFDLNTHNAQKARFGSFERISMEYYLWSEGMRRDYDAVPQAFIDRERPDNVVFICPHSLKIVARLQLSEACSVHGYGKSKAIFDAYADVVLCNDRYILSYLPASLGNHYLLCAIDRKTYTLLWSRKIPMDKQTHKRFQKNKSTTMCLYPGGSMVWLRHGYRSNKISAIAVKDGKSTGRGPWPSRVWYDCHLTPRRDFHDPHKVLKMPPYDWRAVAACDWGGRIWPDGPKAVVDAYSKDVKLLLKDRIISCASPIVRSGLYISGPYTVMHARGNTDRGSCYYVLENSKLYPNMGCDVPVPEAMRVNAPILTTRQDMPP